MRYCKLYENECWKVYNQEGCAEYNDFMRIDTGCDKCEHLKVIKEEE